MRKTFPCDDVTMYKGAISSTGEPLVACVCQTHGRAASKWRTCNKLVWTSNVKNETHTFVVEDNECWNSDQPENKTIWGTFFNMVWTFITTILSPLSGWTTPRLHVQYICRRVKPIQSLTNIVYGTHPLCINSKRTALRISNKNMLFGLHSACCLFVWRLQIGEIVEKYDALCHSVYYV